jgi:formylglycine-generating enzyme required for sulfatase activity
MVQGTPLYMAPEIWRGESATRRSDVYSLGALLFELCAGEPPHKGIPVNLLARHTARRDAKPLLQAAPSVDPRLAAIVDRCLDRIPEARFASGDELREALEQIIPMQRRDSMPEGNPYRGLLPFEAEHRALFFGRSAEIGAVIERLRAESFVVVAGDSGVGKSSLCRAGVLPLVSEGALGGGRAWSEVHVVPGRTPLAAIVAALAPLLRTGAEKLAIQLRAEPTALGRALGKQLGDTSGVVIFVDQLEELVTVSDPAEAEIVGEALGHLASAVPGVRLLVTVRSDFLARVASVPGVGDEISRGVYFLRPLSRENVRDAIVGPARAKGVSFQSRGVVEALIAATVRAEGGLPLLQFALAELWEARGKTKASITAESLEAIGGVAGALARHADQVLLGLHQGRRAAARQILMALVTLEGTRARRSGAELEAGDPAAHEVIEALVRGRLLVVHDTEQGLSYELAHEALLKGWATLRGWLDKQADSRPVKQRLAASAAEWKRLGHTREALWSARRLAEAAIIHPGDLTPHEAAFLDASQRAVRRAGRARKAALLAAPLLLGALYGAIQIGIHRDVEARVGVHADQARAILAEAGWKNDEVNALRAKAFAAFDSQQKDEGEAAWTEALALSAELDRTYGRASQSLESALTIDASRSDVRDLLGDALLDRALAAERDGRTAQRDDLLQRMALHDVSGERRRRWGAPAELVLESSPPGARVTIEPFVEDERQRRVLGGARGLGRAPITEPGIEPGSHLLTLSAENRVIVRYPVVLGRGERVRLVIVMPPIAEIPEGFAYVPPGRFLFGSSADELARREFLAAVPQHQVTTGAYLIAREETTYAQWIDYLRDLPPEERARRAPKVGQAGLNGALELTEVPLGGWQLAFQPTTQSYKARLGEKITYRTRNLRATQDWSRFPVAGISSADAAAYAAWLDGTGRVRGARLCTEQEWERAARGADDREFPSGDQLAPDDANFDATYGGVPNMGPDEVGSHPASRSPFGLDDMTGNIFEWTRSSLAPSEAVVRGGAYYYGRMTGRSTNRTVFPETLRDPRVGLRLCASAPEP